MCVSIYMCLCTCIHYNSQSLYIYTHARMCAKLLSHVQFFATPWTIVRQTPLSMGFPRQECRSGLPFPPPGAPPNPGTKSTSPALAGGFSTTESPDTGSKYYNFSKAVYLSESINSYQLGMSSLTFSFLSSLWTFFDCVLMKFISYFRVLLPGSAILPKEVHLWLTSESCFWPWSDFWADFKQSIPSYIVLYHIQYCTMYNIHLPGWTEATTHSSEYHVGWIP